MKIGKLEQHCGNCSIMDYCAEPFDDLCVCGRADLQEVEERDYRKMAEDIQARNKRHISNQKMCDRICRDIRRFRAAGPERSR